MQFQKGDIGFVMHHDNRISRAIAWFMGSKWSHTTLVIDVGERTYLSETSDYEVTIGWIERYILDPQVSMEVYRLPDLSDAEKLEIVSRALSQQERLYPYWQFISLGLRGLLKKVGIHIGNYMPWGYDCSEHVAYALVKTHYPELQKDPQDQDTEDFYQIVKNIPGISLVYSQN